MIALEQPSMALNDTRLDVRVQMTVTKLIQPDEGVSQILAYVVNEAKALPEKKFRNLVFNCHGDPGELHIGVGIDRSLTDRFSMLVQEGKPIVDVIHFRSCLVARIENPGSTTGNLFCSAVAKAAKCKVVASTAIQVTGYRFSQLGALPSGMIDKFEGTTLLYGPGGNVLDASTNPLWSKWSIRNE
jgi:hypothetical protein